MNFLIFPYISFKFNHYNPPRSLTELTRQITPPTKNGHAPPSIESRMSSQSVVWAPCVSELPQAPVFKVRLSAKPLIQKLFSVLMQIKIIFSKKVLH